MENKSLQTLPENKPSTTFPSAAEWGIMKEQAALLVRTGFLPKAIQAPEQAIAIILKGRELDIGPMHAFNAINVIEGRLSVSPELMLHLIFRAYPNTKIKYNVMTNQKCEIEVGRPGQQPALFSFSIEDARKAGLINKHNWRTYPRAMLRSRAIAEMARSLFPDAIAGCTYTPDELGADTNEDQTELAQPTEPKDPIKKAPLVTQAQITRMFAILNTKAIELDQFRAYVIENFRVESTKHLNQDQYNKAINWLEEQPSKEQAEPEPEPEQEADLQENDPKLAENEAQAEPSDTAEDTSTTVQDLAGPSS